MATTGCTTVYQWQGIVQGMLVALLAEQKFFRTFGVDQQIFEHDVFIFFTYYVRSATTCPICQISCQSACHTMSHMSDQLFTCPICPISYSHVPYVKSALNCPIARSAFSCVMPMYQISCNMCHVSISCHIMSVCPLSCHMFHMPDHLSHNVRMSSQLSSVPYVRSAVAGVVCQICYRMGGKSDQLSQVFTSDHLSRGVISINSLLMVCQFSC